MGSSFFSALNPMSLFGSQSGIGKAIYNDPLNQASRGIGGAIPGGAIVPENGNYGSNQWRGSVVAPNAYQGIAPSLAAAQTGYGTLTPQQQAASAYNQAIAKPYSAGNGYNAAPAAKGYNAGGGW